MYRILVNNICPEAMPLTRVTLRKLFLGLVSIFMAFAILFAILETGFRIAKAIRERSSAPQMVEQSWIVYDEDLIYRPRYLPSPGPKGDGFRVVVLGDSLIAGTRQDSHDSIVGWLDTFTNRDPALRPSEWINTGVPGYTNYQELVYLKKFGLPLQPDLVGVVFCLNDVHKFENNTRVVNGRLLPDSGFWEPSTEAANASRGWVLRLARRSLFLRWLKDRMSLANRAVRMYESTGYDFDYRPDFSTAWQDSRWTMIRDQMAQMAELSKTHPFKLFLVVVPFAEQYRKDYLARDEDYVQKPQRILAGIMADEKIPYLDLYPVLNMQCFQDDHIHLNEQGKQRAAVKIAEFLKTEKLLPLK